MNIFNSNIFNSNTFDTITHRIVKKTPQEIAVDAEIEKASPGVRLNLINHSNYEFLDEAHKLMIHIKNHPAGAGYESYFRITKEKETELIKQIDTLLSNKTVNQKTHRIVKKTPEQIGRDAEIEQAESGKYISISDKTYNELDEEHKSMLYVREHPAGAGYESYYKK